MVSSPIFMFRKLPNLFPSISNSIYKRLATSLLFVLFFTTIVYSANIYKHQIAAEDVAELKKLEEKIDYSDKFGWPVSADEMAQSPNVYGIDFKHIETVFKERIGDDDIYILIYKVSSISFSYIELGISLPSLSFSELERFDFLSSGLIGSIPELNLPKCLVFNLSKNNLTGEMPVLNLPNCTKLFLQENQISGTLSPNMILPLVQEFRINNNLITGIFPQLDMPKLRLLVINWNKLTGFGETFNYPDLEMMFFEGNELAGNLPSFNCPKLEEIWFYNFNFTGEIPEMYLPECTTISFQGNNLTGNMPVLNLPKISKLDLSSNKLSGKVPSLTGMPSLQFLFLDDNEFTSLPGELSHPVLWRLGITSNKIKGGIPQFNMPNLEYLYLASNELTGNIPITLNCPKLRQFFIGNNSLSGIIPQINYPKLDWLQINNNNFEGKFDNSMLPNIRTLEASFNKFDDLPHLRTYSPNLSASFSNCRLDFGDLEKNMDCIWSYQDQDTIEHFRKRSENEIILYVNPAGTDSCFSYMWYRKSKEINHFFVFGQTSDSLKISIADDSNYQYTCRIKNSLVPNLELYTKLSKSSSCINASIFELCSEAGYWDPVENEQDAVETKGKVSINDLLNFEGALKIDTVKLTVKAEGEFYMSDIPVPGGNIGKYSFCKGEYELKLLGEDGSITNFLNSKYDSLGKLFGIDLKIKSLQLVGGRNAKGIKLDCKIGIPGIAGSCGEKDSTKTEIDFNGVEFSTDGISIEGVDIADLGLYFDGYCLKKLSVNYDSEKDVLTSGTEVELPFGKIAGGFKTIKGNIDSIAWHLEASKPPFVLGTTTIGIKGFFGHISSITQPAIEVELGGIFTDITSENFYMVTATGKTVWPSQFEVKGDGKFMKPPVGDKPYQLNGGVSMSYDHPMRMFKLGFDGKAGTSDEKTWLIDGKGEIKLYTRPNPPVLAGSMDGKLTLPKFEDKFPYSWLNSLFSFPIEASTNCKLIWSQTRSIIGDAKFQTDSSNIYGLHYVVDLNKSYDDEGFLYFDTNIEQKSAKIKSGSIATDKTEEINIQQNTEFAVIGVIGNTTNPASTLKTPTGDIYSKTDCPDNIQFSIAPNKNETFWTISNPEAGKWELNIQNPDEKDSILFFVQKKQPDLKLTTTQVGSTVTVSWDPTPFVADEEISILLDDNTTGFDGFIVAVGNANAGEISFNMSEQFSRCSYHLFGQVADNMSVIQSYSDKTINNPKTILDAPVILDASFSYETGKTKIFFQSSQDINTTGYILNIVDEFGNDSTFAILNSGIDYIELDIENALAKNVKITSFDNDGLKGCSSEAKSIDLKTNVRDWETGASGFDNLLFYPNPTSGKGWIKYKVSSESNCKITVIDFYGREIAQVLNEKRKTGEYMQEWDFGNLPNGMYFIIMQTKNSTAKIKCVLSK